MRSIVFSEHGASTTLRAVDRPVPDPGPGEVRVQVVVSGVNPSDWKSRRGRTPGAPTAFDVITPGQDGAGVVDALGPGVTEFAVGDRVWVYMAAQGRPTGTAQQFTVLPVSRVVALPVSASFEVGASLGVPAMTAHRTLTVLEDGPRRLSPGALAGRTVLVAGGAGAVGHAAVQLARWAGARVVATVSGPQKAALALAAGVHAVVNYREDGVASAIREHCPEGVDLVVEVALRSNLALDAAVLRPGGTIASYANDGGDEVTLGIMENLRTNLRLQFVLVYTMGAANLDAAAADITSALADGALPVGADHGLPLTRFPLESTAAAHDAVQAGVVGKALVDVSQHAGPQD